MSVCRYIGVAPISILPANAVAAGAAHYGQLFSPSTPRVGKRSPSAFRTFCIMESPWNGISCLQLALPQPRPQSLGSRILLVFPPRRSISTSLTPPSGNIHIRVHANGGVRPRECFDFIAPEHSHPLRFLRRPK